MMVDMDLNKARALPLEQMHGEDVEETALFKAAAQDAVTFLKSHGWCQDVIERYFCFGIGGVIELFLFRVNRLGPNESVIDEWLWVIVGDIPFAYLVTDDAKSPDEALRAYCYVMQEWVTAVLSKNALSDVYPIAVEPTADNAAQLAVRIEFLLSEIVPLASDGA
jgi:hypothetical protein